MHSYMSQVITEYSRIETAEWPNDLFQFSVIWMTMSCSKFHRVASEL